MRYRAFRYDEPIVSIYDKVMNDVQDIVSSWAELDK